MFVIASRHGGCWLPIPNAPVFEQRDEAKAKAFAAGYLQAHADEFKDGLKAIEVHYVRDDVIT